jgi:glycine cleavage system H protein
MIPEELLFTDQHEWARVEGNIATMGISFFAQHSLGDVTFIELPAVGQNLGKGDEACAIESAKAAASIYAPLSGSVTDVNTEIEDDPALINSDPYGEGWICKIELSDTAELDSLMNAAKYGEFLAGQGEH